MESKAIEGAGAHDRLWPVWLFALLAAAALPLPAAAQAQTTTGTGVGSQFELTYWQSVESGNDPALYEAYLAQYPSGTFAPVARVKLARLRQAQPALQSSGPSVQPVVVQPAPAQPQLSPAQPAPVQPAPAPAPALVPAPAPIIAVAPVPTPAPARRQLAAAAAQASSPSAAATVRPAQRPAQRLAVSEPADSVPYVTAAPPVEPADDNADSAALRRLLGALGDSQRSGAPPPTPIVDAPDAAPLAPAAAPAAGAAGTAPAASAPRLVEVAAPTVLAPAGPPIAVPDAAALSASAAPVSDLSPIAIGPLPAGFALPPRPQLAPIAPLAFPAGFCSATARNAFHDGPYIKAVETAKRNNEAAIAYLNQLQDLYNTNQLSGDINPMNAVAAEARAYKAVAATTFAAQSTIVSAFSTLMAVPIVACEAPRQP